MSEFVVVIPARFASERLPGKPLRDIGGKPMLQRVYEQALASHASEVVIATDDERIMDAAATFSATCYMTSAAHQSGTDRLAEVARRCGWEESRVVVNLQGDEPLMPPQVIGECAALLDEAQADLGTLASPIRSDADYQNPNVVKVVIDAAGYALYFSRAPIPFAAHREERELAWSTALHHHGIYAYRNASLQRIVAAERSVAERCERLEQLRALDLGMKIRVGQPSERPGPGVDTEEDLDAVADIFSGNDQQ